MRAVGAPGRRWPLTAVGGWPSRAIHLSAALQQPPFTVQQRPTRVSQTRSQSALRHASRRAVRHNRRPCVTAAPADGAALPMATCWTLCSALPVSVRRRVHTALSAEAADGTGRALPVSVKASDGGEQRLYGNTRLIRNRWPVTPLPSTAPPGTKGHRHHRPGDVKRHEDDQ